jgi:hypothetical protein
VTLSVEQAEAELRIAKQKLREALIRVQTHRINAVLDDESPDVLPEMTWLMQTGRHQAAMRILELADEFISANVNYQYVKSDEAREYVTAVNAESDEPDYLKGS